MVYIPNRGRPSPSRDQGSYSRYGSRGGRPSYSYSPYVSNPATNPELQASRRYTTQRQNFQAQNPETRYARRSGEARRLNQQRQRNQMAARNAYGAYNYGGGSYMQSPSSSAYGRYVYSGSLDPTARIEQGYEQQRQADIDRYQRWSQGQNNYLGIKNPSLMSSDAFMQNVQHFMNTQKDPMYTADQFMQLQRDYLQGPMTPYVDGVLPAPPAPPPQPEVTYYGGGYGSVPWYGGGGGGGGYGGGGSYTPKDYLPSAYSPYNYGQGTEKPGRAYGSALNLSLWNI